MSRAAFGPAQAHGRHLFAANDPLPAADRELAAKFAGDPADFQLQAVRKVLARRAPEQDAIDRHHAEERAAGFDARTPF